MMAKTLKAFSLALFTGVLALGAPMLMSASGVAVAQEEEERDENAPMKGRQTQAMSKKVYDIVLEANEALQAENYTLARQLIDKVKAMPKLSPYEQAQMYSFYGYLALGQDNYPEAIKSFKRVLDIPDLDPGSFQTTSRALAQLSLATDDNQGAIKYAEQYMKAAGPDADMYAIVGTANYQIASGKGDKATKADWQKVVDPIEKAIAISQEKGAVGRENWWLLLRVGYWEQENYTKVRETLEVLVVNWPKKDYWTQLSAVYFELKNEPRQLAAYEAAYDQGLLDKSSELVQLAQLFLSQEVPYKAARVMEQGLEKGTIERDVRNLRLYAQAWQLAQEDRKAIPPLKEAAGLSDDGELYSRLAQSYLSLSEYGECVTASDNALKKGRLKNEGNTHLIKGMCQFELDQLGNAKASFAKALKFEKTEKMARNWINYVKSEEERLEQLRKSLELADQGIS